MLNHVYHTKYYGKMPVLIDNMKLIFE